jgi:hypothetical protein
MNFEPQAAWLAGKIEINGAVLLFTLGVSLLTVLLFGLIPAVQSSNPDLHAMLKEGYYTASAGRRSRIRSAIVVGQIALVMVLMASTVAAIQLVIGEMRASLGFDPKQVLTVHLTLSASKYADPAKQAAFFKEAVERIGNRPGVQAAAATQELPESFPARIAFDVEGQVSPRPEERRRAGNYVISPDYFRVLSIPLLNGRQFSLSDTKDAPKVSIINETFARRFFPNTNPIGALVLTYPSPNGAPDARVVVGVVGDVMDRRAECQRTAALCAFSSESRQHNDHRVAIE